jgi:glycerol uptake facilitator-like aquaporin
MNLKAYIMEAMGVFFLCYIGGLALAMPKDEKTDANGPNAAIAHMLALAIMIYIGKPTSGAYFNPAVTLALFFTKHGQDGMESICYIISQFIGGFCGGFLIWAFGRSPSFDYSITYPSFQSDSWDLIIKACVGEFFATFF